MATPIGTVCEVCHERRATHHICYGGTGKSSDLCDECFRASAPPDVIQSAAAARDAHCQYCGGESCTGGPDMFAMMTGVLKAKYMCVPCSMEYHQFLQQQLSSAESGFSRLEQLAVIRKLLDEVDAHMKQWIQRDVHGDVV
jgi:hypothetical protein